MNLRMKKFNRIGFAVIIITIFIILVYKAVTFPVVNDETGTATGYSQNTVWEIMMLPSHWPDDHILNTLITKLFIALFGNEPLVIRLPNLLSFLLYAFAIFRINKLVLKEESVFFLPATLLFVTNPYMLDFFGVCRGYGISSALATLSVSYLMSGFSDSKPRSVWLAYILSLLASYTHFTLLVFWCVISLLVWFYFFLKSGIKIRSTIKQTIIIGTITILYLLLIATPIIKLHITNEFQFWTSKGFYWDTIYPLIFYSRTGSFLWFLSPHIFAGIIFLTVIINCIYIFFLLKKTGYKLPALNQPVFIATVVLLLTAFVNIVQCTLLNTPNLHGRTALFFYPLFIIVFVCLLGIIQQFRKKIIHIIIAVCITFLCVYHVSNGYKLNWVREWHFDGDTYNVLDYMKKDYRDEKIKFQTWWFMYNSFSYYVKTGKVPWLELLPYNKSIDTNTNADYYYIFAEDYEKLEPRFDVVLKLTEDRWLLKRRQELK